MGVLAPALGGHRSRCPFKDLEQRLLDAFTRNIAGDRRVLALAGDLVDLVDVDDAGLSLLDVVISRLDELQQDVLDVFAHVPRLGERRRVGNGERDVEHLCQGLGQERLPAACRAEQQDIGLLQLDVAIGVAASLHPLVVVVDRHREDLLGPLLADHVVVQEIENLRRLGELVEADLGRLGKLLLDDVVTEVDALVADVDARAGDELFDLLL